LSHNLETLNVFFGLIFSKMKPKKATSIDVAFPFIY
jgi:hypothetical protein